MVDGKREEWSCYVDLSLFSFCVGLEWERRKSKDWS